MTVRYDVPLVADIHFTPKIAMKVCEAFEKIRVNPGNFVDGRKKFDVINYDDPSQFKAEQSGDSHWHQSWKSIGKNLELLWRYAQGHGGIRD